MAYPSFNPIMSQEPSSDIAASGINKLLRKIETQIDKVVLIHESPERMKEIRKTLASLSEEPSRILKKCIRKMEGLGSKLGFPGHSTDKVLSLKRQVEDLCKKKNGKFDGTKCPSLLVRNRSIDISFPNKRKKHIKNKDKILSYEFREKLTGFLSKRGGILWTDERVDDFIRSLMN